MSASKTTVLFRQILLRIALGVALMIPLGNHAWAQAAAEAWVQRYNGLADLDAHAKKVALDPSGNVIIAGYNTLPAGEDWFVVKYSSAGVEVWTNYFSGSATGNNYGRPVAIGVGGDGKVYVTGWTGSANYDYMTSVHR